MFLIASEEEDRLEEEVKNITKIEQLTDEHISYLVKRNKLYMKDLFEGRTPCQRHSDYKAGGIKKLNLSYKVPLGLYTDDQYSLVLAELMKIYCKSHKRYLNYLMKVLVSEMLIKIYMDVFNVGYTEAENTLML